jgi:hypothetical protein
MTVVCAWCDKHLEEAERQGSTVGICEECLEKLESGNLRMGRGLTSGRCPRCMIRFIWNTSVRLKNALCPFCHTPLKHTTHQFKSGISMAIDRPHIKKEPNCTVGTK